MSQRRKLPDEADTVIVSPQSGQRVRRASGGAVLTIDSLSKRVDQADLLVDVSLAVRDGEYVGLCAENERGKEALLDILSGVAPRMSFQGQVFVDGEVCRLGNPLVARRSGIHVVRSRLTLAPELSVAHNLMLGREPTRLGFLDEARLESEAHVWLQQSGLARELDATRPAGVYSYAERQLLEILRAIAAGARVLVLDEPAAPLSPREAERLVEFLRAQRGEISCLYVSRHMRHLFELCDRISVLRDGRTEQAAHGAPGNRRTVRGRYAIYDEIASGGMASVHLGKVLGSFGFSSTVAIKRLYPQMAKDPHFVAMFFDEARLASRIHHPNVVRVLDVFSEAGELCLVMEYVEGESVARLFRSAASKGKPIPTPIVSSIISSLLHGLHAAHQATDEHGEPLELVHRDVSPQNVIVGTDGVTRVLDFGVAKAAGRSTVSSEGQLKGKVAYMAPEQIRGQAVTHLCDVYGASVLLWELLTLERLFEGETQGEVLGRVLDDLVPPPGDLADGISYELDTLCLRGLSRDPQKRFRNARDMALALEAAVHPATPTEVADYLEDWAGEALEDRRGKLRAMERAEASMRG